MIINISESVFKIDHDSECDCYEDTIVSNDTEIKYTVVCDYCRTLPIK